MAELIGSLDASIICRVCLVQLIGESTLMLIDDGNNRAGCISNDDDDYASGCYTRAVQARVGDRSRAVFPTPAQSSRGTPRSGRRAHTL
jgi:hypothetical protein